MSIKKKKTKIQYNIINRIDNKKSFFVYFRAGVLEPEGTVEIKFRAKEQIQVMHRIDPEILSLRQRLSSVGDSVQTRTAVEQAIKDREAILLPIYHQVAVHFADLHDTPERLLDKNCIQVSL